MHAEVFGLGAMQVLTSGVLLGLVFGAGLRHPAGMSVTVAVLCGLSLALSSTAVALRLLKERGVLRAPLGCMALGILLFQDLGGALRAARAVHGGHAAHRALAVDMSVNLHEVY